ncbi:hypothetical protein ACO0SA_004161 [Hanseniaspora valbyensis]
MSVHSGTLTPRSVHPASPTLDSLVRVSRRAALTIMPTSLHKAQSSVPADSIPLGYNTPEEATFLMIYPTAKTDVGPVKFLEAQAHERQFYKEMVSSPNGILTLMTSCSKEHRQGPNQKQILQITTRALKLVSFPPLIDMPAEGNDAQTGMPPGIPEDAMNFGLA